MAKQRISFTYDPDDPRRRRRKKKDDGIPEWMKLILAAIGIVFLIKILVDTGLLR